MSRSRKIAAAGLALGLCALAVGCASSMREVSSGPATKTAVSMTAPATINPVVNNCNINNPPTAPAVVTPEIAQSGLPCAVAFNDPTVNLDTLQQAFDFNSWLTFVALNAPAADGSGQAEWESWQDLESVMLPGGAKPPAFGTSVPAPAICTGGAPGAPVLQMISKTVVTPTVVTHSGQPLNTGPLIDQNGNYVRYQILVNRPMYDYIVSNGLYSKAGQQAFTDPVSFPVGAVTSGTTGTIGAIVIKAAWKVLAAGDDPATFHSVKGYVYTPASAGTAATCVTQTLGLVGIHIVHKTANEPQWNWATFEHAGNVPTSAATSGKFNFYDPTCSASKCPVNRQPPQPWDASIQPFPNGFHSQIVRTTQYPAQAIKSAARWNPQFQAALKGNVLSNYELVTTQWPTKPDNPTDPNGSPFPLFAANATMETYVQGNVPQSGSSCMACHGNATGTSGKESDFSFVLEKAQ